MDIRTVKVKMWGTTIGYLHRQENGLIGFQYDDKFINLDAPKVSQQMSIMEDLGEDDEDDLYIEIRQYVSKLKTVSISLLQRKFSIGFQRAAKFIDKLEGEGLISPQQNSRPREVYTENFKDIE